MIDRGRAAAASTSARARIGLEQRRAALGHHHRIEHHRHVPDAGRAPPAPPAIVSTDPEHADLHGVDADVLGDRPHLPDDRLGRDRRDPLDGDRVLPGDGRDRRHAVHAAARERLQVGLDPRAAARVRAGDRQDARCAVAGAFGIAALSIRTRTSASARSGAAHIVAARARAATNPSNSSSDRPASTSATSAARARPSTDPTPRLDGLEQPAQARSSRAASAGAAPQASRRRHRRLPGPNSASSTSDGRAHHGRALGQQPVRTRGQRARRPVRAPRRRHGRDPARSSP